MEDIFSDLTPEQRALIDRDYKGKTGEEVLEILKKRIMRKYERFNFSYQRVILLEDFADIINNHQKELKVLGGKAVNAMKEGEVLPSQLLGEYIILEIWSFYDMLREIKSQEKRDLPELPEYLELLKNFRNQVVAHLDKDGRFRSLNEWIEQYEKINKIGLPKIVQDFKEIYFKCCNSLKGDV